MVGGGGLVESCWSCDKRRGVGCGFRRRPSVAPPSKINPRAVDLYQSTYRINGSLQASLQHSRWALSWSLVMSRVRCLFLFTSPQSEDSKQALRNLVVMPVSIEILRSKRR